MTTYDSSKVYNSPEVYDLYGKVASDILSVSIDETVDFVHPAYRNPLAYNENVLYNNALIIKSASDTLSASVSETRLFATVTVVGSDTLSSSVTETVTTKTSSTASDTLVAKALDYSVDMLNNGGYESADLTGIEPYFNPTFTRTALAARTGGFGIRIVTVGAVNPQGILNMPVLGAVIPAGSIVKGSIWFKAPVGTSMVIAGRANNFDGNYIIEGDGAVAITANGNWQFAETLPWTYSTGTFSPGVQMKMVTPADAITIDFDDARVMKTGFSTIIVSALDSLSSSLTETTGVRNNVVGSETLSVSLTEVNTMNTAFNGFETLSASLSETAEVASRSTASDTLAASVTEARQFATVNVTGVDTLIATVGDVTGTGFVTFNSSDVLTSIVNDQMTLRANFPAADVLNATVTETTVPMLVRNPRTDALNVSLIDTRVLVKFSMYKTNVWNGSAWVNGEFYIWNGSAWVAPEMYKWNGTAWV